MTRLLLFVTCFGALISANALAAGYGGASGKNSIGETIYITGDLGETMEVQPRDGNKPRSESYEMKAECPIRTETVLSCLPNRKSPLAGARYKITKSKRWIPCNIEPYNDKSPGEVYICISGCNSPRVPRIFYVSPWEC